MLAPSQLTASAGHELAELTWRTNQPENRVISGYNIYQGQGSGELERITSTPYPGDLDPGFEFETYTAAGLENGVSYRFSVSTVYPNGREVFAADTIEVIPRPEGQTRLLQSFKGAESGFSFARGQSVATDDLSNDIYLTSIKGKLHLASPHRIDVVLRNSGFVAASDEQVKNIEDMDLPLDGAKESIAISAGDRVIVKMQDDRYALIRIESMDTDNVIVQMSYIFQTRPRTLRF